MKEGFRIWVLTTIALLVFAAELCVLTLVALALAVIAPEINIYPLVGTLAVGLPLAGLGLFLALRRRRWAAAVINGVVSLGHLGVATVVFGPMLLARNVTYLLPDGCTGEVAIVFAVPGGIPEETGHGGVVFRIPQDGLLLTASKPPDSSWVRPHYLHQKHDGSLEPIADRWHTTIQDTPENRADRTVGIYLQTGIGSVAFGDCKFSFQDFRVGTMAQHLDYRSTQNLGDRLRERGLCKALAP